MNMDPVADSVQVRQTNGIEIYSLRKLGSTVAVVNKGGMLWSYDAASCGEVLFQSTHPKGVPSAENLARGGIPKMFPIIGPGETLGMGLHGNLRAETFQRITDLAQLNGSDLALEYHHDGNAHPNFPYSYSYRTDYLLPESGRGQTLVQADTIHNTGLQDMEVQIGQHNYFRTASRAVSVLGLKDTPYFDQMSKEQQAATGRSLFMNHVSGEINCLYALPTQRVALADPSWGRRINLSYEGYSQLIVWNPGQRDLGNLAPVNNQYFVCLEPCELSTKMRIPAGGTVKLSQTISVESM
jgi:D-hexose-6-phosphate mutarotase